MGSGMAHDALAMIDYRDDPPVCLMADSGAALELMGAAAEQTGCRVARTVLIHGDGATFAESPSSAPALIELTGAAEVGALVEVLDFAQREAETGARRSVVSAPTALIDLVAARTWHKDINCLFDCDAPARAAAVAWATHRHDPRLHDIGRDDGPLILQQLSEDVGRIAAILASLTEDEAAAITGARAEDVEGKEEPGIDAAFVRSIIRARRLRDQFFRGGLFADPAWDMLLDLMAARLEETRVAVSSLCIAAAVPATTALRWIKALTDRGLFVRSADPEDGRRVYIALSDDAARALTAYLRAVQRTAATSI